jgi:hypothetical protein
MLQVGIPAARNRDELRPFVRRDGQGVVDQFLNLLPASRRHRAPRRRVWSGASRAGL